jgi:hypothetical protein
MQSVKIDDTARGAHFGAGTRRLRLGLGSEDEFRRAIQLNLNFAAHHWWETFTRLGRFDEAAIELKKRRIWIRRF